VLQSVSRRSAALKAKLEFVNPADRVIDFLIFILFLSSTVVDGFIGQAPGVN